MPGFQDGVVNELFKHLIFKNLFEKIRHIDLGLSMKLKTQVYNLLLNVSQKRHILKIKI